MTISLSVAVPPVACSPTVSRKTSAARSCCSKRFDRLAVNMIRAHLFGSGPAAVVPGGMHAFIKTRPELAVRDIELMFRGAPLNARYGNRR